MIDRFRLGTLNLFNYLEPPGAFYQEENVYSALEWERKQAWTADLLHRMACDLVAFQEVFSPGVLAAWCDSLELSHFATVDTPRGDYLWDRPVVALASRFPMTSVATVPVAPPPGCELPPGFAFSRQPVKAVVRLPGFGPLRVYVVHLKSARPLWDPDPDEDELALDTLVMQPQLGAWAATAQRGWEASLLMADIARAQARDPMPTLVMGDCNDQLDSAALSPLLCRTRSPRLGPLQGRMTDEQALAFNHRYALRDARAIALNGANTSPTYYWGPQGLQLDHILLSADFDPLYGQSLCQVDKVELFDRHLVQNDPVLDRQCSDHAAIVAELSVRR